MLPDGTKLNNRLLGSLPQDTYATIAKDLRLTAVKVGDSVIEPGVSVSHVYFPNGGVYSITCEMRDGQLVEVSTVGIEGMLGVGVFLGDRLGTGRTLLQVPNGPLPGMAVGRFARHIAEPGPLRDVVSRYAQAHLLQIMQCTACNALHRVEQRCCRWLLETQDRIGADEFLLKHEFLAIMLGTTRPTVTLVMGGLQKTGIVRSHYGQIRVLDRKKLEAGSCECYRVTRAQFTRLGL